MRTELAGWIKKQFKGLVAIATLFIYFVFFNTCIPNHIHRMIPYIHPSPFAEASLHFLIALVLSGEKPPCGAEPRIELGPAFQQADALPTVPRRTISLRIEFVGLVLSSTLLLHGWVRSEAMRMVNYRN